MLNKVIKIITTSLNVIILFVSVQSNAEILSRSTVDGKGLLITQNQEAPFESGDYLCVFEDQLDLACGFAEMSNPTSIILRVTFLHSVEKLKIGQKVRLSKAPPESAAALNDINTIKLNDWELPHYQVKYAYPDKPGSTISNTPGPAARKTHMLGLAFHNLNPQIHWQMETDYFHTIGIELGAQFYSTHLGIFQNKKLNGTLVGGCLTFGYYTDGPFQGYWVKGGLGLYAGALSQGNRRGDVKALTGELFLGKRWLTPKRSYGLAFGLQATSIPHSNFLNDDAQLFVPTLNFEIGFLL